MATDHHIQRDSRLWGLPEWATLAHLDRLPEGARTISGRKDADGEYLLAEYNDGTEQKIRPGDLREPEPTPVSEPFTPAPVLDDVPDLEDTPVDHTQAP